MVVCFMFPDNYPNDPIIMELKSKVLSDRLLDGLSRVCEEEAKKLTGQRQVCTGHPENCSLYFTRGTFWIIEVLCLKMISK